MKAVILAGGLGTRISEETHLKPKPMVEIGGYPILWHIMKIYSAQGINEFIICAGYKGYLIKEYFANYFMHMSDVTFDIAIHGGGDDFAADATLHFRDFLGAFVDQQDHQMDFRMILANGVGNLLEEHRFACPGRSDEQSPLSFPDRSQEVHDPHGDGSGAGLGVS